MALVLVPLVLSGIALFGGCNDDPTHFGPAGGLAGRSPDDQAPPTPDSGGSSGTSGDGGASSGCTPDAAGCPSFATDIYAALMATAGTYKCANGTACHATGGNSPAGLTDATATLAALKAYKINGKPYLTTSCDPTQSAITCNLLATGAAGACGNHMPLAPTPDVSAADLAKIKLWLTCGSPP